MHWWTFHEQELDWELARREAERVTAGASAEAAKAESAAIRNFLLAAKPLHGPQVRPAGEIRADLQKRL